MIIITTYHKIRIDIKTIFQMFHLNTLNKLMILFQTLKKTRKREMAAWLIILMLLAVIIIVAKIITP